MPDSNDNDEQPIVIDLVNNPVVAYPNPPGFLPTLHPHHSGRTRVISQRPKAWEDPILNRRWQPAKLTLRGR